MPLASMLAHVIGRRIDQITGKGAPTAFRSPAPLGLYQGSAVALDETVHVLQEVSGGVMPAFAAAQSVVSVGRMTHSGQEWVRSYLSGGKAFIETVPDPRDRTKATQVRLWVEEREIMPTTAQDWQALLDPTTGILGYNAFQLDPSPTLPKAVVYGRAWSPAGPEMVPPVDAVESVADDRGTSGSVRHSLMLYSRKLSDGSPEYVLADVMRTDDTAFLDVFVGMDISPSQMTVMPAGNHA